MRKEVSAGWVGCRSSCAGSGGFYRRGCRVCAEVAAGRCPARVKMLGLTSSSEHPTTLPLRPKEWCGWV